MPDTPAQQRLAELRELKATGAEEIDRRGRVRLRSLKEMKQIEADLVREVDAETNPGRARIRRIVVTPSRGF